MGTFSPNLFTFHGSIFLLDFRFLWVDCLRNFGHNATNAECLESTYHLRTVCSCHTNSAHEFFFLQLTNYFFPTFTNFSVTFFLMALLAALQFLLECPPTIFLDCVGFLWCLETGWPNRENVSLLGEFSPIGRLFTFGSFLKNYRSSPNLGLLFSRLKFWRYIGIIFENKWVGLNIFWAKKLNKVA
jgi:hypothetical protein